MATVLYRLGRFSFRRRGTVLAAWLLLLALAGAGAVTLSGPTSDSFTIPGTEAQQGLDLLEERMPGSGAAGASARVVFVGEDGGAVTTPAATTGVKQAVAAMQELPGVAQVTDPYGSGAVSPDGTTAYATVAYSVEAMELTGEDQRALLAAGRTAEAAGLTVEFGGDAVQAKIEQGATEVVGLAIAAVVLVITFGSLLAAGLPLVTAVAGVGLGVLGITIATGFFDISTTSLSLAVMLGLAVGIDYALFIVSRYRHELLAGHSGEEAAGRAVGTAGSAVVFAGLTVVIALAALSVVGIPFLTAMGLGAAGTVLGAVVIALTLLPALLGLLGRRVLGRRGTGRDTESESGAGRPAMGERWVRFVLRRRVPLLLAIVVGLGIVAVPALDMRRGLPSDATAATDSTQRRAYDAIATAFGPGVNGPLLVTVDLAGTTDRDAAVAALQADLASVDGVAAVTPAVRTPAGDTAVLTLIPATGPTDAATEDLVHAIRAQAAGWESSTGAGIYVTGTTAVGIDVSGKLADALLPYLAIVVGLAFLLLTLVFRSLLVPLKATLGFLLSIAATFGAVVWVFQQGHLAGLIGLETTGPILSFLPILTVGILFGLAMDYEVFLVTRMREEHVHGASAQDAVVHGFRHGARVVTAAAAIMVAVFAGFALAPDPTIKSIGFALAVGIVVDAFLVRMTVVPAVMSLLGRRAWSIPRRLDALLPDVDVEGEKLTRMLAPPAAAASPSPAADAERTPVHAGG
jgi:RND superfamily putative drug exporter